MKSRPKSLLIGGCVGGGGYAAMMAAFDYYNGQEFSLWKFIFNFLVFGGSNAFITGYSFKHAGKKQQE